MFREKINDSRLHKDLQRSRSGRTQLLRKDYGDNKFISEENADVILKHERPEMYAELIHDEWYWVNGCSKCEDAYNYGESYSYQVCYEHDRCVGCKTQRSDLKDTPWGHEDGFLCKPCGDKREADARKEAFIKRDKEDNNYWDYSNNDHIKCPHCNSDLGDRWEHDLPDHDSSQIECCVCGGELEVRMEYTIDYSTSIVGERVTK